MKDTFTDALIACVKASGGSKSVGPTLWPELESDAAQRKLCDCLNPERPHHNLAPEQALLIMRLARSRGCHAAMEFLAGALDYAPPVPTKPVDIADNLRRELLEELRAVHAKLDRLEAIERPALRSAA